MNETELRGRLGWLANEIKGFATAHPDLNFPDDIAEKTRQYTQEMQDIKGKLDSITRNRDMVKGLADFDAYMNQPAMQPNFPTNSGESKAADTRAPAYKSISNMVLDDNEYAKWFKSMAPNGHFAEKVRVASPQVQIPGGLKSLIAGGWGSKALVTGASDSSAGAFVFNDVQRNLDQYITRRPLVMRDIITIGQTTSDLIEYVRQVSETNNAAMVPEASSTAPIGDGTGGTVTAAVGGLKPESAMVFERVTTPVRTVAHWMPATKRALADAGQMQTLIDGFLRYGLDEELEDQMVLGDGNGENFVGLANISNLTAQTWDTNELVTTRRAKTKVRVVGRATPNAFLLNPYDWETIQLIRADASGTEGPFLFGGPASNEVPTLWNLPVVECESLPQGVGYVGDFRTLILWDREQAGVQMTDSHNDFFVRNLVAILAEARAAFGCLKPAAIVEMDLTAA